MDETKQTEMEEAAPVEKPAMQEEKAMAPKAAEKKTKKAPKKAAPKEAPKPAPAKKPAKKKAAKPAARQHGPWVRHFKFKEKDDGLCGIKGCKTKKAGLRWCASHKKQIRKVQLKLNNVTWRKRIEEGKAGHHLSYRGKPTAFTAEHQKKALLLAKKGHGVMTPTQLREAIKKAAKGEVVQRRRAKNEKKLQVIEKQMKVRAEKKAVKKAA